MYDVWEPVSVVEYVGMVSDKGRLSGKVGVYGVRGMFNGCRGASGDVVNSVFGAESDSRLSG
jgi:hypothetical protein